MCLSKQYAEGTAADQNATKWDFYVSSRCHIIDSRVALEKHTNRNCYQVVSCDDDRPVEVLSVDIGFGVFTHRQFRWMEAEALNIIYDSLQEPRSVAFMSNFTWYAYESLYKDPVYRIDLNPKRDGRLYCSMRNLTNGENTMELSNINVDDLWLDIPEFDAYDELKRWNREPVFSIAVELLQKAKRRWNLI